MCINTEGLGARYTCALEASTARHLPEARSPHACALVISSSQHHAVIAAHGPRLQTITVTCTCRMRLLSLAPVHISSYIRLRGTLVS